MPTVDDLLAVLVTLEAGPKLDELTTALGLDPGDLILEAEDQGLVTTWEPEH
jgi:hypothetical protein